MNINKTVNDNNNINEELKSIIIECYKNIYSCLGENNFKRWIHQKEFEEELENLICDWMSKEENEKYPGWDGYATYVGAPEIRIDKSSRDKNDTLTHEMFHTLTRKAERFGVYINEGMTEYFKILTNKNREKGYSYGENVRLVEFLHKMIGDSLIKAYLLGKDKTFVEKIDRKFFNNESNRDFNYFTSILDERHKLIHSGSKEEIEEKNKNKDEYDKRKKESKEKIKQCIKDIIVGKVNQDIENLKYYKDGKIDVKPFFDLMQEVPGDFSFDLNEKQILYTQVLGKVFENSHILIGLDEKEKQVKKEELINQVLNIYKDKEGKIASIQTNPKIIETENNEDLLAKYFRTSFLNVEKLSTLEFTHKVLNILTLIPGTKMEQDSLISEYAIKKLGKDVDVRLVDKLIKGNLERYQNLSEDKENNEQKVIDSSFRQINDNSFIEKRDNAFYYIHINEKGQKIELQLDSYQSTIDKSSKKIYSINESKNENGIKKYRVTSDKIIDSFVIEDGLESVKSIRGEDKYKSLGIMTFEDFQNLQFISPLIKEIREKQMNGKYRKIMDDEENVYDIEGVMYSQDIDKRSRNLNFEDFKSDILDLEKIIPNSKVVRKMQEVLIEELLDQTYHISKKINDNNEFERDEEIQKAYDQIKEEVFSKETNLDKVNQNTDVLNKVRKKVIEENEKKCAVFFETPQAQKRYSEKQIVKKIARECRLKFKFLDDMKFIGQKKLKEYYELSRRL